jgi:hypothetical protein
MASPAIAVTKLRPSGRNLFAFTAGIPRNSWPHPPASHRQQTTISLEREETKDRIVQLQKEENPTGAAPHREPRRASGNTDGTV